MKENCAGLSTMSADLTEAFAPRQELARTLLLHIDASDSAHDAGHLVRVWRNVCRIAAQEGGDIDILAAATLLHDAVHVPKDDPRRPMASQLSADRARDVLARLGWDDARIAQVTHAIAAHSYSAGIAPQSVEAQILQDADRLDAIGAVGIARCFAVSGSLGRAIAHPTDPGAAKRRPDDLRHALDHFEIKLLRLADGFQTATGRALAAERHDRLVAFRAHFLDEAAPTV